MTTCKVIPYTEAQSVTDGKATKQETRSARSHPSIQHHLINEGTTPAGDTGSMRTNSRLPISTEVKKAEVGDVIANTKKVAVSTGTEEKVPGGTDTKETVRAATGMRMAIRGTTDTADAGTTRDRLSKG